MAVAVFLDTALLLCSFHKLNVSACDWSTSVLLTRYMCLQKLPDSVRTCSRLMQLDLAANDDLDVLPAGPYLSNLKDLDISRCDFHR